MQVARLRRMAFGRSSEKLTHQADQLELGLEEREAEAATAAMRDYQEFCAGGRLPSLDDEALTEDYGELTFGLTPFARWALPFVRRVIEHEI